MLTQVEQIMAEEFTELEKQRRIISAIHMCRDLGVEKTKVLLQLAEKFSISEEEAKKCIEDNWTW